MIWLGLVLAPPSIRAETFRVATYNVDNYLDAATQTRREKRAEAKAAVRASIRAVQPQVLALQEMGTPGALEELRAALKAEGLDYPYWEHVSGHDTNVHVAILSQFPLVARRSHTNESFLLSGRRFWVSRGFGEVDIQVKTNYSFTLITAHLKSRRVAPEADEAELRLEEAKLLREKIEARLAINPQANLVVAGDFNDTQDTAPVKTILGRGKRKLLDTRPAERHGDGSSEVVQETSPVTWTYYYAKEDSYARIDFVLASPGMAREWVTNETYVLRMPNWGVGSDHRPLVATFEAQDK
ncbi:MAG TPA: endonuclease/exonuclease/phosphatase family protein [Bacillota bacterium]|nr:endonuclease/exonuclease/phosphatase family protein [Bacillota bacterium]